MGVRRLDPLLGPLDDAGRADGIGQESGGCPHPDTSPLARYCSHATTWSPTSNLPSSNPHKDAWQKTAAYKMLNETTLGTMLEDVGSQVIERLLSSRPDRRVTGTEVVKLVENLVQSGFVFAAAGVPDHPREVGDGPGAPRGFPARSFARPPVDSWS